MNVLETNTKTFTREPLFKCMGKTEDLCFWSNRLKTPAHDVLNYFHHLCCKTIGEEGGGQEEWFWGILINLLSPPYSMNYVLMIRGKSPLTHTNSSWMCVAMGEPPILDDLQQRASSEFMHNYIYISFKPFFFTGYLNQLRDRLRLWSVWG